MEKTNMKHLSSTRCILLLLFYFVGYTYLLPRILTVLTLMVDPQATTFNIPISVVSYVMIMVLLFGSQSRFGWIPFYNSKRIGKNIYL